MRGIRILITGLICVSLACADKTSGPGQSSPGSYENYFAGGAAWGTRSMLATEDGGCLVLGHAHNRQELDWDMLLLELDSAGELLWSRSYGGPTEEQAAALLPVDDGFLLIASARPDVGEDLDGWLVWVDAVGDSLDSRFYGGDNFDEFEAGVQCSDGGFVLAGSSASFGDPDRDLWLVRVDAGGEEMWSRTYGGEGIDSAGDLVLLEDDHVAVVGTTNRTTGPDDPRRGRIWVLRADAAGDTLWTRTYGGDRTIHEGEAIDLDADGNLVIAGQGAPNSVSERFGCRVMGLSTQGELLWSETHLGDGNAMGYTLTCLDGGGALVGGVTMTEIWDMTGSAFLLRVDDEGRLRWSRQISPPSELFLIPLALLPESGDSFLVSGTHWLSYGYVSTEWWLARIVF